MSSAAPAVPATAPGRLVCGQVRRDRPVVLGSAPGPGAATSL